MSASSAPVAGERSWTICPACRVAYDDRDAPHPPHPYCAGSVVKVVKLSRLRAAEEALFECAKLSGADVSGGVPTDPPLAKWVIECVRELRTDSDAEEVFEELGLVRAERDRLAEALNKIRRRGCRRDSAISDIAREALASLEQKED